MHIVHILTRLLRAGSEENILLTSAGQIAAGDTVTLMFGADSTADLAQKLTPKARLVKIPSLVRPIRPGQDWAAFHQMHDALRALAPDVVHTHQSKAGILGRFAAHTARIRCVVHGVHILPFIGTCGAKRQAYLRAERMAARVTHGYIHVSRGMLGGCRDNGVGPHVPHQVIPSGFDLERFRRATPPPDHAALLGGPPSDDGHRPITLLMIASLEPRKRHLPLLDHLAPLLRDSPQIRLMFAGEGPLEHMIRARAEALGLGAAIRLLGYRNDVERIIAMSDICCLASGQEGLPRSVLQYLVAGKPTVLFDLPGLTEVITPGENALVIAPDDWAGFQATVTRLVHDQDARNRLSQAAARTDLSKWDWTRMGRDTTAFYRHVLNQRQAG